MAEQLAAGPDHDRFVSDICRHAASKSFHGALRQACAEPPYSANPAVTDYQIAAGDPMGELKRAMSAMDAPSDGQATLEQILAKGRQMQANEQQQSLQWTAKELANVMKGQIEDTTGAKVQSVEVQLAMKKQSTDAEIASSVDLPVIQRVVVQMAGWRRRNQARLHRWINRSLPHMKRMKLRQISQVLSRSRFSR